MAVRPIENGHVKDIETAPDAPLLSLDDLRAQLQATGEDATITSIRFTC